MDKAQPERQFPTIKNWITAKSQGPLLFRLCIAGLICIVLLIFIINYPANLPLWRFDATELALVLLLGLNLFWIDPNLLSTQQRPVLDWVFLVTSALLILAAVGLSNQLDVIYLLSVVCVQADLKRGVWPAGLVFGAANLIAWLAYQIAVQSSFNEIIARETALATGIIFGFLGVSLLERYARQTRRAETLLAELQAAQRALEAAHQKEKELAVAEERIRLARELHDSVTQELYSVTLYAQAASDLLAAGESNTAAQHLRDLSEIAQQAMREMRLLIFELRRPALDQAGLAAALQDRLEAVERRGGLHTELQAEGCAQLTQMVQTELYAIAQEALNNVLKHACARNIQVLLRCQENLTELEVCDDGIGFEPTIDRPSGGFGLAGMRERARKIGGTVQIESEPGQGTKVSVHVPATQGGEAGPNPENQNELAAARLEKDS